MHESDTPRPTTPRRVVARAVAVAAGAASILAVGLTVPAFASDPTVNCRPAPPASANLAVARSVYDTGRSLGVSAKVMLAGFEAAVVETRVNNCSNGDLDSVGVFQQRNSWGSYANRTTVSWAATQFFVRAKAFDTAGRKAGQIAQKVQVSAFPARYDQSQAVAQRLIDQLGGATPAQPVLPTLTAAAATIPGSSAGWTVRGNGRVTALANAGFYGDARGITLNAPVVGMASSATGHGYWLAASDGGVFSYGDAAFYGSMGGKPLNKPVVGITATPSGHGYWLVASDGGVFSYGDAAFRGAGTGTGPDVVAIARTATGYELVRVDGSISIF